MNKNDLDRHITGDYGENSVDHDLPYCPPQKPYISRSKCQWAEDASGVFETSCGKAHIFIAGGPAENRYKYCQYCGRRIFMKGDVDSKECEYTLTLKVELRHRLPPENNAERREREVIQNQLHFYVNKWMSDQKNQQNLMNMILGNTGILI